MDEAQRRGRSSIDALYREMEEVQGELSRIPPGLADSTYLRQRLVELQAQIAQKETAHHAEVAALEGQMATLKEEVAFLQHSLDQSAVTLRDKYNRL
jgi:predicted  nucleic acid-binding Zn-ribbon protein